MAPITLFTSQDVSPVVNEEANAKVNWVAICTVSQKDVAVELLNEEANAKVNWVAICTIA
jgi:hypothetical protein